MKCFYHPRTEAVARCKNCQKGLCPECSVDVGNGMACKDKCEDEVRAINELLDKEKTAFQKLARVHSVWAVLILLLGIIFVLIGFMNPSFAVVTIPGGIIFVIGAALTRRSGRSFLQKQQD